MEMNRTEKYEYFWNQVAPLLVKRVNTVDLCRSGSIIYCTFELEPSDRRLMFATPFWNGVQGIDVQWTNDDGVGLGGDTIPWDISGDPEVDLLRYYRVVENYIEAMESHTVERYLEKLRDGLEHKETGYTRIALR
jgi:hypothetical protein